VKTSGFHTVLGAPMGAGTSASLSANTEHCRAFMMLLPRKTKTKTVIHKASAFDHIFVRLLRLRKKALCFGTAVASEQEHSHSRQFEPTHRGKSVVNKPPDLTYCCDHFCKTLQHYNTLSYDRSGVSVITRIECLCGRRCRAP
jgi:hypothetical protein